MSNFNNDMREEVASVKKELNEIKKQYVASEILQDQRKQNKRLFILLIIVLCMWAATIGYLIYVLNDIEVVETVEENYDYTQDVNGIGDMNNSNIVNGGNINGKD